MFEVVDHWAPAILRLMRTPNETIQEDLGQVGCFTQNVLHLILWKLNGCRVDVQYYSATKEANALQVSAVSAFTSALKPSVIHDHLRLFGISALLSQTMALRQAEVGIGHSRHSNNGLGLLGW